MVRLMDDLQVSHDLVIPSAELQWRFDPSGGPGGQHANRSSTRVELRFDITRSSALEPSLRERILERLGNEAPHGVVTIKVGESRSQWRNRQIARRLLSEKLHRAMRPPAPSRRQTRRTRASHEQRLAQKRARGEIKRLRRKPDVE
jgi:ribosome-associated protein